MTGEIVVTGGTGFLGQHVCALLKEAGYNLRVFPGRRQLDLRSPSWIFFHDASVVVHLAYPGTKGIQTSMEAAADLVHNQLLIDLNVVRAAATQRVSKLICVGSVCEYPEQVSYPAGEDQLWSGYPEAVNAPYGIAKRMQQGLLEAYRRQYGLQSIQLVLGNLYGPGDQSGHVIPSLIRRACHAAKDETPLVVWGDGTATREFLYVEDAARAIVNAVEVVPQAQPINVVSGEETPIAELAGDVAAYCGFTGAITWDPTKPNGQPRRWFANRRAFETLGWTPLMPFSEGLRQTVAWLREKEHL